MTDFWPGRRVMVTGGGGFLGTAVVRRLEAAGATEIFVPRSADYDLRTMDGIDRALADGEPGARDPPRRGRRRDRGQSREPGPVLLRERDHGHPAHGAGAARRRRRSSSRSGRSAPTRSSRPCRSRRTTSGTATRRRRTRRTAWPSGCSWSRARPIASSTASTPSTCCRSTCTARATTSIRPAPTSSRRSSRSAWTRSRVGADHIDVWGTGSASREFLYVDDAAEGIVLAAERYDGAEPVNLGTGQEITIRELVELIAECHRLHGRDPLGPDEAGRAAATGARHESGMGVLRVPGEDPVRGGTKDDD